MTPAGNIPLRPSDPRPNGVPYYIPNQCDDCGRALVLRPDNKGWLDTFICPQCKNGEYLDLPPELTARLLKRQE